MTVCEMTLGLSVICSAAKLGGSRLSAAQEESTDAEVFGHNLDSFAGYQRRVHIVIVLVDNNTDGCFQLRKVTIIRHETIGIATVPNITG